MTLLDAWNKCPHGGTVARPSGAFVEKWMGDKPGLPTGFDRWLSENAGLIPATDLMAGDWEIVA